ncbi:hypothetical protein ABU549_004420 [Yersinia enterocolitica]|jgi:hypothetical protein
MRKLMRVVLDYWQRAINQADTDANAGEQTRPPQNNFQATYQVAFLFGSP